MRIVALVPGGIGDQILFFPTLDDLKRYYPEALIDVIAEPRAIGAYRVCKSVNQALPFDFKDRNSLADWGNLLGVLRDREYDVALFSGNSWLVGLLLWLAGIPTRIGYSGTGSIFLTKSLPSKASQYAAQMYHDLLQGLGISSPCPDLALSVPKPDITWAENEQRRLDILDSGYVLIYDSSRQLPEVKGLAQTYPVQSWKQIIQNFQQRQPELPVVLLQNSDNQLLIQELLLACPDVKVTIPGDVGKLAAIIASASLMLCTASAPMHLAVAVGTYTIALFGLSDPQKLLPGSDRFLAIKSPTTKMDDIPPQTVLERIWHG